MKKILTIALLLGLTGTLQANNKNLYVGYTVGQTSVDKVKILESEPFGNVVGKGGKRQELEIGMLATQRYLAKHRYYIYAYAYQYDKHKNYEKGGGIGGKFDYVTKKNNYGFTFTAQSGFGSQKVKGNTLYTKTNVNNINYAIGQKIETGKFKGKYLADTGVFEIDWGIGAFYKWRRFVVTAQYQYVHSFYSFMYLVNGSSHYTGLSGVAQGNNYLNIGLKYIF